MSQDTEYCKVYVLRMISSFLCVLNRGQGSQKRTVSKEDRNSIQITKEEVGCLNSTEKQSQASWRGEEPQEVSTSHPRNWSGRWICLVNVAMRYSCSAEMERGCWEDSSRQQQTCDRYRLSKSIKQKDLTNPVDFIHPVPTLSTPSRPIHTYDLMTQKEALAPTLISVYIFLLQAISLY